MLRPHYIFTLLAVIGILPSLLWASSWRLPRLSAQEVMEITRNGLAHRLTEKEDSMWPASTLYAYLDMTPAQALGIFTDFDIHKNFVPKLLESKLLREQRREKEAQIQFIYDTPFVLRDLSLTVESLVEDLGQGAYQITWFEADRERNSGIKPNSARIRFYPVSEGRCLFEFYTMLVPQSRWQVLLKWWASQEVKAVFVAVANQLKVVHRQGGSYLKRREAYLRRLIPSIALVARGR